MYIYICEQLGNLKEPACSNKLSVHILCNMWRIYHFMWCTVLWLTNIAHCIKGGMPLHRVSDGTVFTVWRSLSIKHDVGFTTVDTAASWLYVCPLTGPVALWFPLVSFSPSFRDRGETERKNTLSGDSQRKRACVLVCVCVFVGLPWDDARVLSVFHRGGTNSPSEWCNQSNKASISAAGGIPVEYIWQQGASHT